MSIAISDGTKFGAPFIATTEFGEGWETYMPKMMADINGDGFLDAVGFGYDGVLVSYNLKSSNGRSWSQDLNEIMGLNFTQMTQWDVVKDIRVAKDMNGDGMADLVGFKNDGLYVSIASGKKGSNNISYTNPKRWVQDFGTAQAWDKTIHPRYLADVNGDGRPEPVGFDINGVYVSPSSPLYCCDKFNFADTGGGNKQVNGALVARVYLPKAEIVINKPGIPNTCVGHTEYKNPLEPVVTNGTNGLAPWNTQFTARFMMNANFFVLYKALKLHDPSGTCTNAKGWAISDGEVISRFDQVHAKDTQTLAIYNDGRTDHQGTVIFAEIIEKDEVDGRLNEIDDAVSGLHLLKDKVYLKDNMPSKITPEINRARSAIGVTKDGETLIFVVVNNGKDKGAYPDAGTTTQGLADLLIDLGANDALALDGSGSAQFRFDNGTPAARITSVGSDNLKDSHGTIIAENLYRRVPVFIGVK